MKKEDFASTSSGVRVLEKRMLQGSSIETISTSPDVSSALKLITQNSEFDFSNAQTSIDYELVLKNSLKTLQKDAYKMAGENREIVDLLNAKYLFHNLKTTLKAFFMGKKFVEYNHIFIETDIFPINLIFDLVSDKELLKGDGKVLISNYKLDTAQITYANLIVDTIVDAKEIYNIYSDIYYVDVLVDKKMFEFITFLGEKINNELIKQYVLMSIDHYNIMVFFRLREMKENKKLLQFSLAEGGETAKSFFEDNFEEPKSNLIQSFFYKSFGEITKVGFENFEKHKNFSYLEKSFDDRIIELAKKSKTIPFGAEVLFFYFVVKEFEIKQVRLILTCKNSGLSDLELKRRLRISYA